MTVIDSVNKILTSRAKRRQDEHQRLKGSRERFIEAAISGTDGFDEEEIEELLDVHFGGSATSLGEAVQARIELDRLREAVAELPAVQAELTAISKKQRAAIEDFDQTKRDHEALLQQLANERGRINTEVNRLKKLKSKLLESDPEFADRRQELIGERDALRDQIHSNNTRIELLKRNVAQGESDVRQTARSIANSADGKVELRKRLSRLQTSLAKQKRELAETELNRRNAIERRAEIVTQLQG